MGTCQAAPLLRRSIHNTSSRGLPKDHPHKISLDFRNCSKVGEPSFVGVHSDCTRFCIGQFTVPCQGDDQRKNPRDISGLRFCFKVGEPSLVWAHLPGTPFCIGQSTILFFQNGVPTKTATRHLWVLENTLKLGSHLSSGATQNGTPVQQRSIHSSFSRGLPKEDQRDISGL